MLRLTSNMRGQDRRDRLSDAIGYMPSTLETLTAKVKEGFRFTTTGMLLDEQAVVEAERDAYGYSPLGGQPGAGFLTPQSVIDQATKGKEPIKYYTEEEYRESPYFREGVEWKDTYTEQRARILAEQYDQRRYVDEIIDRRSRVEGAGEKVLGFGASMLGNLPDPINLIPLGGGLVRGGKLAARVGSGALEGLVGTAIADAIVMPSLKRRGEDIGFADYVADLMAGTLLGGVFSGVGHGVKRAREKMARARRPELNRVVDGAFDEMGIERPARATDEQLDAADRAISERVRQEPPEGVTRYIDETARREGIPIRIDEMTPEQYEQIRFGSRAVVSGIARQDFYAGLEKAVSDVTTGRDPDVSSIIGSSSFYQKLPNEAKAMIDLSPLTPQDADLPPIDQRIAEADAQMETPLEVAEIERLQAEGELRADEAEEFRATEEQANMVDRYEEASLQILECVVGVTDG